MSPPERMRPASPRSHSLADVAAFLSVPSPTGSAPAGSAPAAAVPAAVTGVTLDSRAVVPGDLYAALPGARTHGATFVAQAVANGAVAVLTDPLGRSLAGDAGVPVLEVPQPRDVLGQLASWLYGDPAGQLVTFGVTGTNGKTTTSWLLASVLEAAGHGTALVGTVETRVLGRRVPSRRTTPEAPDLHALLAVLVEQGGTAAAMEVSSHALVLHRVDGLRFDVAGFTNLSQDHLDFHPSMEEYFAAKCRLFTPEHARRGVVCVDGEWGRRLAGVSGIPVTTLARTPVVDADWQVRGVRPAGAGSDFRLEGPDGTVLDAHCPLAGDFNVENTALALVMAVTAGLDGAAAAAALAAGPQVPGRMERVRGSRPTGTIGIVDYAHTPDAVAAALAALADGRRRVVVVLGAGGDRDRGKRAAMGRAAAAGAAVVVVTDDNPRSEDPALIRADIAAAARAAGGAEVLDVADRALAIGTAVELAGEGGTVLVAGKGHEQGQEVGGVTHPFDDRAVLARALDRVAGPGRATHVDGTHERSTS